MAKVEFAKTNNGTHFVPALGRDVEPGEVVEVPDEAYESFVPPKENRSKDHPWLGVVAPTTKAAKPALKKKD